eukprot:7177595-Prymnesium_polylepis.1
MGGRHTARRALIRGLAIYRHDNNNARGYVSHASRRPPAAPVRARRRATPRSAQLRSCAGRRRQ